MKMFDKRYLDVRSLGYIEEFAEHQCPKSERVNAIKAVVFKQCNDGNHTLTIASKDEGVLFYDSPFDYILTHEQALVALGCKAYGNRFVYEGLLIEDLKLIPTKEQLEAFNRMNGCKVSEGQWFEIQRLTEVCDSLGDAPTHSIAEALEEVLKGDYIHPKTTDELRAEVEAGRAVAMCEHVYKVVDGKLLNSYCFVEEWGETCLEFWPDYKVYLKRLEALGLDLKGVKLRSEDEL